MKKHGVFHYIFTVFIYLIVRTVSLIISVAAVVGGYFIFVHQKSPYNFVLGFPLMLAGAGLAVNALWSVIQVIFSPSYNRGVCRLCASTLATKLTKKR